MRAILLLACSAALALPGAAIAQANDYEQAVELRRTDPAAAAALLERWLDAHPGDTDALVQYGYALLTLGQLAEAEQAFAAALAIAPGYTDASEGIALIAARRADRQETRRGFALVEGALSDLGSGQRDWHELGAVIGAPVGLLGTLEGQVRWFDRFGAEDVELGALYTHKAGENLWLRAGASATPSADFRPEIGLAAGLDYRLAPSSVATLDVSWQRFPAQDVVSLRPGFTQYFGGGRYALGVFGRAVFVDGDALVGGSVRADWLPADRTRAFVGVASGPETDLGEVRDTTSLYGGGEVPLSATVSLLGSLSREWRATGADRTEARLGVKLAF
ncbi:YaiO family outer membrane beta-barrel protein [Aurantiacibacter arachoides]|nr:YaiO family outer membrane beta-barrel protein [Aurantiacibacter arachoides]GGD65184.1 hypothetical protein GCM10011411_26880 [Aurantiacibacter arachoides]